MTIPRLCVKAFVDSEAHTFNLRLPQPHFNHPLFYRLTHTDRLICGFGAVAFRISTGGKRVK